MDVRSLTVGTIFEPVSNALLITYKSALLNWKFLFIDKHDNLAVLHKNKAYRGGLLRGVVYFCHLGSIMVSNRVFHMPLKYVPISSFF